MELYTNKKKCTCEYTEKYMKMSNSERIAYNKNIRGALNILESIKNDLTENDFKTIYSNIVSDFIVSV
jgi:hypothetical protein